VKERRAVVTWAAHSALNGVGVQRRWNAPMHTDIIRLDVPNITDEINETSGPSLWRGSARVIAAALGKQACHSYGPNHSKRGAAVSPCYIVVVRSCR
jgi:hypothetical protein